VKSMIQPSLYGVSVWLRCEKAQQTCRVLIRHYQT